MALVAMLTPAKTFAEDAGPISLLPTANEKTVTTRSATVPSVVVRVGQHEDFDRIVFDWPHSVPYKVIHNGSDVTVQFSAAGAVSVKPAEKLTRGHNFSSAQDEDGKLKVLFHVDAKATIKDFSNGNSIAVDIFGAPVEKVESAARTPEIEKPEPAVPVKAPRQSVEAAPVDAIKPSIEPVKTVAAENKGKVVADVATAGSQPQKPQSPNEQSITQTTEQKEETKPIDAALTSSATTLPPAQGEVAKKPDPAAAVASKKVMRDIPTINIGTRPVLVATFDPHTATRVAVWQRAGYAYILFDKTLSLTIDQLTAGATPPSVRIQPVEMTKSTAFRFAIPDKVEVRTSRDNTAWNIYLTKMQPDVPVTTSLIPQPDFALGARYLLPLPDAPEPVRFFDPNVGDNLVVVPLSQPSSFTVSRHMADFHVLAAAQGLIVKPLTDKLVVRSVSDGIEITSDAGLRMSPSTETGISQQSAQKSKAAASGKSLFDFSVWAGNKNDSFTRSRQKFQQAIVDVPEREKNRATLEFARFYFAHGYGAEALGLLNYLAKEVPDLTAHSDFLALTGATKILANRPDEGLKDLEATGMIDVPEIKLWQAVANAEVGNWVEAEEKFSSSEALLAGYPEPFYSRFFVLAIESALAVGNDHEAADWLNQLQQAEQEGKEIPAIDYLHGVLHAKAGRAQAAAASWKKASRSHDRLYKVRSEMALIDLGVANLSLTPAQAADRLEALRFAWRGDDLEVDILHRLGLFYIKSKNVKAGLSSLAQAVKLYPHSPIVPKVTEEMMATFRDVFLGEVSKTMSPLDALGIYQQYKDTLMPSGEDAINTTKSLAERLSAIDLVDQSCDLLEDLAKNKLKGAEKGRVVVRLAALRMVDHRAQEALEALDLSSGDFLPAGIQQERLLLRARALLELHRHEEALAEISSDERFPAKILRAEINMSAKNWDEASKNLLELVGAPPQAGQAFTNEQADWLLRAAVCLAMKGDQVGLDRLAIDYSAAMAGSAQNDAFRILVQPDKIGESKDIIAAQKRLTEVDMFQSFLNYYRKSDASDQVLDRQAP